MGSEFALIIRSIVTIDSLAIDDVLALFGSDKGQVVSSNKIRYSTNHSTELRIDLESANDFQTSSFYFLRSHWWC